MRYAITTYPTLGRSVRTVSRRQRRDDGPSGRTGTGGALAQDRSRATRRRRKQISGYLVHNRLNTRHTLTYRDEDLPDNWQHAQRQMKAFIRRMLNSPLVNTWPGGPFPHLHVISINGESQRPHVHLALPKGFSQELVQGWWPHGAATLDGCFPDDALEASAEYLVVNIEESALLRSTTRGYHLASGCQPPVETLVFDIEAEQLAHFHHEERVSTIYWTPPTPEPWGTYEVRLDPTPMLYFERGRVGLATNLPAGPCLHGARGCPTCHPPKTPSRSRGRS